MVIYVGLVVDNLMDHLLTLCFALIDVVYEYVVVLLLHPMVVRKDPLVALHVSGGVIDFTYKVVVLADVHRLCHSSVLASSLATQVSIQLNVLA